MENHDLPKKKTLENFGGTEDSQKFMKTRKNATVGTNGGTRKCWKIMISEKNGTLENFVGIEDSRKFMKTGTFEKNGGNRKFWKIMTSGKVGHSKISGAARNSRKNMKIQPKRDI